MPFVYPDCTSEVTTSTGAGPIIVLEGPEPSFGAFSMRMAVGDETTVRREDGLNFELLRVRLLDPGTDGRYRLEVLARLDSSNGGAPVNWPAGQQRVFAVQLGRYALLPPASDAAGRPVVVQPDGRYGAGAIDLPVPAGLTLGTLLDAASAGGRPDGAALIRLVVTWEALPGLDYELEIRDGLTAGWPGTASGAAIVPAGGGRHVLPVVGGYTYGVRLRARTVGGLSGWTVEQIIAATGDDTPPGAPTVVSVTAVYGGAVVQFTPPADADTLEVRLYAAATADRTAAVLAGAGLHRVSLTGLPAGATRWLWLAAVDTSGNEGAWVALGPVTALLIEAGDLAAELGERIERLAAIDTGALELAGEAALEAVLAAHEVGQAASRHTEAVRDTLTGTINDRVGAVDAKIDAQMDGIGEQLAGVLARLGSAETAIVTETEQRSDAVGSLASRLDLVAAQTDSTVAAVQAEQQARTTADSALGQRIDTVVATANGNTAAIQAETTARTDADTSLGQRIDTVVATANGNAAAIQAETTARTNADTALGQRIDTVVASAAGNTAAIQAEATARTNADTALGQRIDTVVATANGNTAAIQAETTARTNADTALGQRIDNVVATANGNTTAIQTEQTARANADTALGQRIDTVVARSTSLFNALRRWDFSTGTEGWGVSFATMQWLSAGNVRISSTGNDPMFAIWGLGLNAGTAPIVCASITRRGGSGWDGSLFFTTPGHGEGPYGTAAPNPSLAIGETAVITWRPGAVAGTDWASATVNSLRLDFGASPADVFDIHWVAVGAAAPGADTAAIQVEATARADADTALGQRIDTVVATANGNTAAIQAETTARTNADTALGQRIDNVVATANGNTTAIQTEQTARANADTALGQRIDTVQTTVNGHTASIQQQAVSIGGLSAQWTLKLNAGGKVVGIGAAASVDVSELVFMADALKVVSTVNGTPVVPFAVVNGVATFNVAMMGQAWIADVHIGPDGIDAGKIRAGSVLAGTVKVGTTALSTIAGNAALGAQDPAARINAAATTIDPGRVLVKGTTTLTAIGGWMYGDTTEINGGAVRARTLEGSALKAGSLSITEMGVFSTGNMIENATFTAGLAGWFQGWNTNGAAHNLNLNPAGPAWALYGHDTPGFHQPNAVSGGFADLFYKPINRNNAGYFLPVQEGKCYEWSVFTGTHRCACEVLIIFYNTAGTEVGVAWGQYNTMEAAGGQSLSAYKRIWAQGVAPAGAVYALPVLRKHNTVAGQADSWVFFTHALFAECAPNATGPQPFQPGGATVITGGHLATSNLITDSAQIGNATVTTLKIGLDQVTLPRSSYVESFGYIPDQNTTINTGPWLDSIGQPVQISVSLMQVHDIYGDQSLGQPTLQLEVQRGQWTPGGVIWTTLVGTLGGSLTMRDTSASSGISKPWTFTVVDRSQGAGSFVYRLNAKRLVAANIVSIVYCTLSYMECRR